MGAEADQAQAELDEARKALAMIEHCAPDTEAIERYVHALRVRNDTRKAAAE